MTRMSFGIRTKQFLGFGVVLFFLAAVGFVGLRNTATFSAEFQNLYDHNLKAAIYLANAERGLWELRFALPNYLAGDTEAREKIKADTDKWAKQVDVNLKAYGALSKTELEKDLLKEWDQNYSVYLRARPQFFALLDAGKTDEAKKFRALETNPPAARAVAALSRLNELQQKIGGEKQRAVTSTAETSMTLMYGLIAVALVSGVAISVLISRSVARPLRAMVTMLKDIAEGEGDLTQRLHANTSDEIGEMATWFNVFMDKLHDIISRMKQAAVQAAAAAQQLAAASERLASGAQEHASTLEETAASLEEIAGTVKQTADNAKQANQLAVGSRDTAELGGRVVTAAVSAMGEINQASKKIADIITTIDEIAFQTNLLALNAAVEAARAGEQGRGFAVVAAEVRNLAQRSATAAKEIKGLIQDSVERVGAGSQLVNQSGQTLTEIVTSVKRVTDIIAEIAAASHEQSSGVDQVNRAVTQMDQVTQSNAAQTEELSSTAEALAEQAMELQALVGRFKLADGSRGQGSQATPAASAGAKPPAKAHRVKARAKNAPEPVLAGTAAASNGHGPDGDFEEF